MRWLVLLIGHFVTRTFKRQRFFVCFYFLDLVFVFDLHALLNCALKSMQLMYINLLFHFNVCLFDLFFFCRLTIGRICRTGLISPFLVSSRVSMVWCSGSYALGLNQWKRNYEAKIECSKAYQEWRNKMNASVSIFT